MPAHARSGWLVDLAPTHARARMRLFCFPFAGGSASVFRDWPRLLPDGVAVNAAQYPGRADRWREPPLTELRPMVDAMADAVRPYVDEPYLFFGHSMGALIAFETARRLKVERGREPLHLFVSGCSAPREDRSFPTLAVLDDEELRRTLAEFGLAEDVLDDEELMEVLLPMVRADLEVADGYRRWPGPLLTCPIAACRGVDDPFVPVDGLAGWGECTQGSFTCWEMPGGHLFRDEQWPAVVGRFWAQLTSGYQEAMSAPWA